MQKSQSEQSLIDRIKLQRELTRRDCVESFYNFFQYFWGAIVPESLVDNWHIRYLCAELQLIGEQIIRREISEYDLIINIPPGTTKSTITTVMFPAWLWLRDSTLRVISGSYSAEIAIDHAVKSRHLLKSFKFQELYGDLIAFSPDQDNKSYYQNTAGGTRSACGVGGAITGKHGHIIIIDDPINPKQSNSEAYRKTANDWMKNTLSTRKVDKAKTPTILIMQRLHEDDPTGNRLQKGRVKHICLPSEVSELDNISPPELEQYYIDGLLDTVRMSHDVLTNEREQLGSAEYAGQYLQSPTAAEGNLFKRDWFQYYGELPKGRPQRVVNSWDTAFKKGEENDFSACTTWFEYENGFYLVDMFQDKLEFPDLKRQIPIQSLKWRAHYNLIEDKASGQSLIQELRLKGKITIIAVQVDKDKIARAKMSTPAIEAKKVFLPEAGWINIFLDQMCGFPNTKNDDIVDTVSQFLNWARENPFDTPRAVGRGRRQTNNLLRGNSYDAAKF